MKDMLTARHITVRYGTHAVVQDLSFSLGEGQWLMLIGPNGAGKSSLIGAISRSIPSEGQFLLNGVDAKTKKASELAREIGVLMQHNAVGYRYTVEEIVRLGRYAHTRGLFGNRDDGGEEKVREALSLTGLTELSEKSVTELSGGELQRTFLAQVLAQEPRLLLLDEPANHLDLCYQQTVFSLVGQWLKTPGRAVISVVHDLNLARRYGTHAVLMDRGKCVSQGEIGSVMTEENLSRVYGMDVFLWMRELLEMWK